MFAQWATISVIQIKGPHRSSARHRARTPTLGLTFVKSVFWPREHDR
jgi:hypothetical protein